MAWGVAAVAVLPRRPVPDAVVRLLGDRWPFDADRLGVRRPTGRAVGVARGRVGTGPVVDGRGAHRRLGKRWCAGNVGRGREIREIRDQCRADRGAGLRRRVHRPGFAPYRVRVAGAGCAGDRPLRFGVEDARGTGRVGFERVGHGRIGIRGEIRACVGGWCVPVGRGSCRGVRGGVVGRAGTRHIGLRGRIVGPGCVAPVGSRRIVARAGDVAGGLGLRGSAVRSAGCGFPLGVPIGVGRAGGAVPVRSVLRAVGPGFGPGIGGIGERIMVG